MRFSEGPWWVPGAIVLILIASIWAAPTQTGHLVGTLVRGGVAAIDAATGDAITGDQPISITSDEAQP